MEKTFTVEELNAKLLSLSMTPGVEGVASFRVKATLSEYQEIFSNVVDLNVTPYSSLLDLSTSLGVVGSGTPGGWGNENILDLPFYTTSTTNVFVAYVTLRNGEIKFRNNNDWSENWGDDGNDGTLDSYGAGIQIREVKMQKVDPPSAVIDSFRDVQAARADQERARNEANAYANKVVPEAQGESEKIRRESEAYQSQTVAEAEGQAKRFVSIYSEYIEAKDVTRQRLFLETMEKVFNDMNKVIIDSDAVGGQGVLPYLPLNEVRKKGDQ